MPRPPALAHRGPTKPMHDDESWFEDITGGLRLKSRPRGHRGGEFDALEAINPRTRRRLAGAGYTTPHGEPPDVLAEVIGAALGRDMSTDDAVAWYVRQAVHVLTVRRIHAHRIRHQRVARRHGRPTYYAHRDACARAAGHRSLYHYRLAKGWPAR